MCEVGGGGGGESESGQEVCYKLLIQNVPLITSHTLTHSQSPAGLDGGESVADSASFAADGEETASDRDRDLEAARGQLVPHQVHVHV